MPFDVKKTQPGRGKRENDEGFSKIDLKKFKPGFSWIDAADKKWKISNLRLALVPPPPNVASRLPRCAPVLAFDTETHMKVQENLSCWVDGQFGFKSRITQFGLRPLRVVQLGWAIGSNAGSSKYGRIVKPEGFDIDPEVNTIHSITNGRAALEGVPLREALQDFLHAAFTCVKEGGRLVAQHIERGP